ncbi:hypothetical protein PUNSTDRAFT_145252 [Punctularia strigosozonata HHB-11173 SS5]|uniref:uncharacterized protein n=1 Tax=Punctularia strigosozonata (strain HHB-11173) TaxID=741275 RepID=UPI000441806F|nr:uncharacterized protein PUNSTDRAFT_145252 [Punctularia strigosozonata HHB-11173 SS5]EIN06745.1 hypothetical protein PUNSTDRAFT_145252 [Punctularia strigosozonata HHB-11173 SS5]
MSGLPRLPSIEEMLPERLFEQAQQPRSGRVPSGRESLQSRAPPVQSNNAASANPSAMLMHARPSATHPEHYPQANDPRTSRRDGRLNAWPVPAQERGPYSVPSDNNQRRALPSTSPNEQSSFTENESDGDSEGSRGQRHPRGTVHECDVCGRQFSRPSSLATHYNIHTGNRPFECPYPNCGRLFSVNSNMRRHYRNHFQPLPEERPGLPAGQRVFRLDQFHGYNNVPNMPSTNAPTPPFGQLMPSTSNTSIQPSTSSFTFVDSSATAANARMRAPR